MTWRRMRGCGNAEGRCGFRDESRRAITLGGCGRGGAQTTFDSYLQWTVGTIPTHE